MGTSKAARKMLASVSLVLGISWTFAPSLGQPGGGGGEMPCCYKDIRAKPHQYMGPFPCTNCAVWNLCPGGDDCVAGNAYFDCGTSMLSPVTCTIYQGGTCRELPTGEKVCVRDGTSVPAGNSTGWVYLYYEPQGCGAEM